MRSHILYFLFLEVFSSAPLVFTLGINCQGSGLCPRATWNNNNAVSVIQLLRDVIYASPKSNSTTYNSGDHIICLSQSQPITVSAGPSVGIDGVSVGGSIELTGNIPEGGICLFPQGASLTLGQIKPLVDAILDHKCSTCGSVPIHFVDQGSNDPSSGILTFNYVAAPTCDGQCISDTGTNTESPSSSTSSSSPNPLTSSATASSEANPELTSSHMVTPTTTTASSHTANPNTPTKPITVVGPLSQPTTTSDSSEAAITTGSSTPSPTIVPNQPTTSSEAAAALSTATESPTLSESGAMESRASTTSAQSTTAAPVVTVTAESSSSSNGGTTTTVQPSQSGVSVVTVSVSPAATSSSTVASSSSKSEGLRLLAWNYWTLWTPIAPWLLLAI